MTLDECYLAEELLTDEEYGMYNCRLFDLVSRYNPGKSVRWCADRVTSANPNIREEALNEIYEWRRTKQQSS